MSFSIINQGNNANSPMLNEYMIDSVTDLQFLPDDAAPGSIAATADLTAIYRLSNSGEWVKVGG